MLRQLLSKISIRAKPRAATAMEPRISEIRGTEQPDNSERDSSTKVRDLVAYAVSQRKQGNSLNARKTLEQVLTVDPGNGWGHHEMAQICVQEQDLEAASDHIRLAAHFLPNEAGVLYTLGAVEYLQGRTIEAIQAYQKSLAVSPAQADVLIDLGIVLLARRDFQVARDAFSRALRIAPNLGRAQIGLAQSLLELGQYSEALLHIEAALNSGLDLTPALTTRGLILSALGRLDEGIRTYQRVLEQDACNWACRWNIALNLLLMGDFHRGWPAYEVRWESPDARRRTFNFPEWKGESLPEGVLLIYGEQGLGDELMFASCIEHAQQRCARIVLECDVRLVGLFARSFPSATVIGRPDPRGAIAVPQSLGITHQVALGSLPNFFRKSRPAFPSHRGYIKADAERCEFWRYRLERDLGAVSRIGVSWRGGSDNTRRNLRSLDLESLRGLLQTDNAGFVSLQYGSHIDTEIAGLDGNLCRRLRHYPEAIADYDETAALVSNLDLVISVQTSVVHLAGALGRTVWVMVPFSPEWRYGRDGTDMSWYPSAHLYRQPQPLDWRTVITQVTMDLHAWIRRTSISTGDALVEPARGDD